MFAWIRLLLPLFILSGCASQQIPWGKMNTAEAEFNQRQQENLLIHMSVERLFPEPRLRKLAVAAGNGDIAQINQLVEEGVGVNGRGYENATPLFWSLRNIDGFIRLLELGADPNVVFNDGGNVIHWALRKKNPSFLAAALSHGGNPNIEGGMLGEPLIFAATGPEAKNKARLIIDAGANINSRGYNNRTPMMAAAGLGQFDLVYELLSSGANPTLRDLDGRSLKDVIELRRKTMDPNHELTRWMHKVIERLES
jgi:ankyrin repeat protein